MSANDYQCSNNAMATVLAGVMYNIQTQCMLSVSIREMTRNVQWLCRIGYWPMAGLVMAISIGWLYDWLTRMSSLFNGVANDSVALNESRMANITVGNNVAS